MRILLLTNNFSGLYSFRREVVEAMLDEGHEMIVSAPVDSRAKDIEQLGCKVINTVFDRKCKNPLKDIWLLFCYWKLMKQIKPNVVLTYTIKPNVYGGMACQLTGMPQIANITGLGAAVETSGWLQKLTILLYRIGLRKAKTVFFQNRANMAFCEKHKMVKGNRIQIPGSGVNLQYHAMQAYPAEHPLRFLFIGRLMRQKGIEEYLAAAKSIRDRYPDTEFHIVGSCEEAYDYMLKDLQNRGIIYYHGRLEDIRPIIGMCYCTVHPSFYPEGMSNVLLESCAAGRPIITTDRPGCGEIVDEGVNGFIVKPQDAEDLAKAIEKFIQLPYCQKKAMGLAARRKVEREFDRNIVVRAYLEELKNIESNGHL